MLFTIKKLPVKKIFAEIIKPKEMVGSLYIPESAQIDNREARVLMIGKNVRFIAVGDIVRYHPHTGTKIDYKNKECIFLNVETDIDLIL
jgi:co-chaperonin GroES (HSP10)